MSRPRPGDPLSPAAVGARVVVRHATGEGPTDVLGVLEHLDPDRLVVRRADGGRVEVATGRVLAGKVVPARTVTGRQVRALEAAAARGWPGLVQELLGGWLLRAGGGFTGRANSVLPLADPGMPVAAAVDAVEAWYDARGLEPRAQLPDRLGDALGRELARRGWPAYNETLVLSSELEPLAALARPDDAAVRVDPTPDDAWVAGYHYRGGALPAVAVDVLTRGDGLGFASVRQPGDGTGGGVLAIARGAVTDGPDGRRWLGVTAVEVEPDGRGRGLGRTLMTGLARWGLERGARTVYLQVAEDNEEALAFYERLGLAEHHRYRYRRRGTLSGR